MTAFRWRRTSRSHIARTIVQIFPTWRYGKFDNTEIIFNYLGRVYPSIPFIRNRGVIWAMAKIHRLQYRQRFDVHEKFSFRSRLNSTESMLWQRIATSAGLTANFGLRDPWPEYKWTLCTAMFDWIGFDNVILGPWYQSVIITLPDIGTILCEISTIKALGNPQFCTSIQCRVTWLESENLKYCNNEFCLVILYEVLTESDDFGAKLPLTSWRRIQIQVRKKRTVVIQQATLLHFRLATVEKMLWWTCRTRGRSTTLFSEDITPPFSFTKI